MTYAPADAPFAIELELRDLGLSWPETHEDFPWGERALKVNKKVFCFLGTSAQEDGSHRFFFTVKLPESAAIATAQPWATPTGYGLGKSGWISARFDRPEDVPTALLRDWLDESYRTVAPKRALKKRDAAA